MTEQEILDRIRAANEQPFDKPQNEVYIEKKSEYAIKDGVDYPDPEYLIDIGGVPTMPKGNLVALSAKWKNGKTFFCDIISAIFLGSRAFGQCTALQSTGKVQFFDTEQAVSDTARIRKTIKAMTPQERHGDLDVYCLRNAEIDTDEDDNKRISRFDFIKHSIEQDHPDLVIIDGIADLIYNYNDVNESNDMVSRLAAIANEHNCCIVVVMHQNKGQKDKNMKGHLGTMLFQKCSDVFNVEKCGSVFVVSHGVSRHRQCDDIAFKLDANAVPMDAFADRQLQVEMERQQAESKMREMLSGIVPEDGGPVKRSEVANYLVENYPFKRAKAYQVVNEQLKKGWLVAVDRSTIKLNTHYGQIDEQMADACEDGEDSIEEND